MYSSVATVGSRGSPRTPESFKFFPYMHFCVRHLLDFIARKNSTSTYALALTNKIQCSRYFQLLQLFIVQILTTILFFRCKPFSTLLIFNWKMGEMVIATPPQVKCQLILWVICMIVLETPGKQFFSRSLQEMSERKFF